jgi:hypothetical protein
LVEVARLLKDIFKMATTYSRIRPRSETTLRVEALLGRYPNLSEQEIAELINLFPTISILDQGLMTADADLSGKFRDFHVEHGKKLRLPISSLIIFLAVPVTLAITALIFMLA